MARFSLYRITVIVAMFIKFVLQLYFFNKRHKNWDASTYELWEALLKNQAAEYREKATKLQGLMIKVGQFLSTRADFLPKAFLDELEGLVDQVPPVPSETSMKVLKQEWGVDIDDYLSTISEKPVASASIGEVYRGTLHNGHEVAIKIQRYRIDGIINTDFKALRIVLWIARKFTKVGKKANLKELYKELVSTISDELNYEKELKNGQYFQHRYHDCSDILVPSFYEEFSTRRVLVMEWMEGAKVTDTVFLAKHKLDRKKISNLLFDFFVGQLLEHGTYHADPHPGNILINKQGQLMIIDFGMIGKIKKEDEVQLRKMIQGFVLSDYELIIEQLEFLGFLLPHADKRQLQSIIKQGVEIYLDGSLASLDKESIEMIMDDIHEMVLKQPIQLPAEYAFLGRAVIIALGVLTMVNPKIDFIELSKPVIQKWLQEGDDEKFSFQILKDSVQPLLSIPRNLNQWLESPKLERKALDEHHWSRFDHQRKLVSLSFSIFLFLISIIFLFLSIILEHPYLYIASSIVAAISIVTSIIFHINHKHWVRQGRSNQKK